MARSAMSCIEEEADMKIMHPRAFLAVAALLGLGACAQNPMQSEMRLSPDFGDAVR